MSLKRTALTFGIALAALAGSSIAALAAPAYATSNVNVRSGPGPSYGAIDVLRRGDSVDIDYCRGSWCFVNKSGPDGWVSANYLSRGGYDDDYYDDDFYIDQRPIVRPWRSRPYRDYYYGPRSSACVGGPNASFCITN
jgi:uncharacterized protein YraI